MIRGAILLLLVAVTIKANPLNEFYKPMWSEFKKTHSKMYETVEEEAARFNVFVENQRQIDEHNKNFQAGTVSFEMGMNQYGDMTNEEFRAVMNGYRRGTKGKNPTFQKPSNVNIPDSVDWRTKGYVTDVKDQKQCGSCWAFSATGSLEGQHFKATGKLVSLSEQNLVDCSQSFGNEGCNGGWMDDAFSYIKSNQGIDTEASYPYTARDGKCAFKKENIGATDTGFTDIKQNDESDLEAAIATVGPISVAIDASKMSFQFYKSGVYYEPRCSATQLDHGVLAVGYGTNDKGEKYYIVKNSWNASWGDKGYILMARERNNHCGIATAASYPLV
jgi:cathepsin L